MKKIVLATAIMLASSFSIQAQQSREGTPEEKAAHAKNVKGIMGKWKTTSTEIEVVEEQLKSKKQEVEKIYNGLFNNAQWEFKNDGKFSITNLIEGKSSTDHGTFTIVANKLTLYLSGNTLHCTMQMKADNNMVVAIFVTEKTRFGMLMEKQK